MDFFWCCLIFWSGWNCPHLISWITIYAEELIQPVEDEEEALGLAHVLPVLDESCFLWWSMKQALIVVIDGEDSGMSISHSSLAKHSRMILTHHQLH
jgi:hypothetical protein